MPPRHGGAGCHQACSGPGGGTRDAGVLERMPSVGLPRGTEKHPAVLSAVAHKLPHTMCGAELPWQCPCGSAEGGPSAGSQD